MNTDTQSPAVKPAPSESFYQGSTFDMETAKSAYYAMMERFGYPIPDALRSDIFWVCDFLQGDFARVGMGGVFWINDKGIYGTKGGGHYSGDFEKKDYGYLGHEIYLLPGQILPEHRHTGGDEGYGPKMESWQVRYGDVHFFGEHKRAGDEILISDMPKEEQPLGFGEDWFNSKYVVHRTAKAGGLYTLEDPESWHFQRAGAQGAIVTEYATYHNHVEFSKPGMEFDSSK